MQSNFGFLEAAEVAQFFNEKFTALSKIGKLAIPGKDSHQRPRRPTASFGGKVQARRFLKQSRRSPWRWNLREEKLMTGETPLEEGTRPWGPMKRSVES